MTRRYKARDRSGLEPVTFEVEYQDKVPATIKVRNPETLEFEAQETTRVENKIETFSCRGDVNLLVLADLGVHAGASVVDVQAAVLMREMLAGMFGDEAEYARFQRFITGRLDFDEVLEIIQDLVEDFMERPTRQPSDSPSEPETTGDDSTVVHLPGGYAVASTG